MVNCLLVFILFFFLGLYSCAQFTFPTMVYTLAKQLHSGPFLTLHAHNRQQLHEDQLKSNGFILALLLVHVGKISGGIVFLPGSFNKEWNFLSQNRLFVCVRPWMNISGIYHRGNIGPRIKGTLFIVYLVAFDKKVWVWISDGVHQFLGNQSPIERVGRPFDDPSRWSIPRTTCCWQ